MKYEIAFNDTIRIVYGNENGISYSRIFDSEFGRRAVFDLDTTDDEESALVHDYLKDIPFNIMHQKLKESPAGLTIALANHWYQDKLQALLEVLLLKKEVGL